MNAFVKDGESGKEILEITTAGKILWEIYQRLTEKDRIIEGLRVSARYVM